MSRPTRAILAKRNLPVLSGFALSNVLLAFDYDGTLAPIASTPAQARMRARTQALMARVSRRYPCVVISGRALADISQRVRKIPLWYVFGNHGLEPAPKGQTRSGRTAEWLRELRRQLPDHPGVVIEDKRHTVTVHYRAARDQRRAAAEIDEVAQTLTDARVVDGAAAINILPRNGPNKGIALQRALKLFGCRAAIYVGDDATDEDAFGAIPAERMLGIRVGRAAVSHARYHLTSQREIDDLLRTLAGFRATHFPKRPEID